MTTFNNVTVVKKANIYFNGQVSSRTVQFADGSKKTLGLMLAGEYSFSTEVAEVMEIMAGKLTVLLPGSEQWQSISAGQSFQVPANAEFKLNVTEPTDYCCSYLS